MLLRRLEAFSASLLPHLAEADRKREIDSLDHEFFTLGNEEEIESVERLASARLIEMKKPRPPVTRTWRPKAKKKKRRI